MKDALLESKASAIEYALSVCERVKHKPIAWHCLEIPMRFFEKIVCEFIRKKSIRKK
jgi:hypothetical protein